MKYPNLILFLTSVIIAVILSVSGVLDGFFRGIGGFGYAGAFVSGMLFAFSITAPIATAAFYYLGDFNNPVIIGLIGGIGAALSDVALLGFFKNRLFSEIEALWDRHNNIFKREIFISLFHTKLFHTLGLFLAGVLILSPLPDELGVAILAYYKLNPKKLLPLSLALNGIGIYLIAELGRAL